MLYCNQSFQNGCQHFFVANFELRARIICGSYHHNLCDITGSFCHFIVSVRVEIKQGLSSFLMWGQGGILFRVEWCECLFQTKVYVRLNTVFFLLCDFDYSSHLINSNSNSHGVQPIQFKFQLMNWMKASSKILPWREEVVLCFFIPPPLLSVLFLRASPPSCSSGSSITGIPLYSLAMSCPIWMGLILRRDVGDKILAMLCGNQTHHSGQRFSQWRITGGAVEQTAHDTTQPRRIAQSINSPQPRHYISLLGELAESANGFFFAVRAYRNGWTLV